MKRSSRPRATAKLSRSLNHQLNKYALAAVGLLSLTRPAGAEIVYTPTHKTIALGRPVLLDLNHDRVSDFSLIHLGWCSSGCKEYTDFLSVRPAVTSNKICVGLSSQRQRYFASALPAGASIGSLNAQGPSAKMAGVFWVGYRWLSNSYGPWCNVKDRYLGLKFVAKDGLHYGWARLSVRCEKSLHKTRATLTGYAYETIPNKSIIAGKTKGPDAITVQPAGLGHLAAGASAIPAWRVKQTAATTR